MPLYGAQLWDHSHKCMDQFHVTWRKGIRKLLRLPNTCHSNLLHLICDDMPLMDQLYARSVSFMRGLNASANHLTRLCYNIIINGSGSSVSNTLSILRERYRVTRQDICRINVTNYIPHVIEDEIMASMVRDLITMRHGSGCWDTANGFSHDEIEFMINHICTV